VTDGKLHLKRGSSAEGAFSLAITPEQAGWAFSGLRVLELAPGASHGFDSGPDELLVLPLAGGCVVDCDGERFEVTGRDDVFDRVTDFVYVPRDAHAEVTSPGGGRFALPSARARRRLAARYGAAADVPVELRGAGQASRQVNNFCRPDSFEADKLIAVEVLTPGGNWSSWPPHKHDQERPPEETQLEEVYYYEISSGPPQATATEAPDSPGGRTPPPRSIEGVGYQRVYSSGPDRRIDVRAEVRTGDVVLVPYGWHGPSMAAPGYDMYYLNVMAGPGEERAWRFCEDPAHAWVRATWAGQAVDPRLPMTSEVGRRRAPAGVSEVGGAPGGGGPPSVSVEERRR
jgi:5-deoxy-glucuronate isomerase